MPHVQKKKLAIKLTKSKWMWNIFMDIDSLRRA